MLKILRNKKLNKRVWLVLAPVIILSFLLWGSQSLLQSLSKENYAGRVFGRKISLVEFADALMATRIKLIMQMGETFLNQEKEMNLEPIAWDRIILLSEAKRRKIRIDDHEVGDFIQTHPFFLNQDGEFDFAAYQRIIQYVFRMKPRDFEEKIREDLILSKLHQEITSKIDLSQEKIESAYKRENEEISVNYLSALPKDFENKVSLDDAQIREFFSANRREFKKPVSFNLEYLFIPSSASEEKTGKSYRPEELREIYRKAKGKKDLRQVADEFSLELKETGFFGLTDPIPGIGWSMEIINLLGGIKPGKLIPPVKTTQGWYILKLKEKKESYLPLLEEVKAEVKEKLLELKSKELAREKLQQAHLKIKEDQKVKGEKINLFAIARKFNIKNDTTDFFKRASYIPGVGSSDIFFAVVSSLEEGKASEIIEMEQGFFIVQLKEKIPVDQEKFEEEKEEFARKLLLKERDQRFLEFLLRLRKKAKLTIVRELSI